jgi:hypothetical protein
MVHLGVVMMLFCVTLFALLVVIISSLHMLVHTGIHTGIHHNTDPDVTRLHLLPLLLAAAQFALACYPYVPSPIALAQAVGELVAEQQRSSSK